MANKKRSADSIILLSKEQLIARIKDLPSLRDKALVSFLYLSGARVSEALSVRADQIVLTKENNEGYMIIRSLPILKRRRRVYRDIPIKMAFDEELANYVITYASKLEDSEVMFKINRHRVYQIVNKKMGLYPHLLRHFRCSHLVKPPYNLREFNLQQYIGWSTSNMASTYVKTSMADIMELWEK